MYFHLFLHFEYVQIKPDEENLNVEKVNSDDVIQMTSSAYQQFADKYQKIPNEGKWTLKTGKIVEDTLYTFGMKCSHEQ